MVVPRSLTRAALVALTLVAIGGAPARAATTPAVPPTDAVLTEQKAVAAFLATGKVAAWLERYPPDPKTDATYNRATSRWRVHVWSGKAGEIATGVVDDKSRAVLEAWTGPQVAWGMARGRPGAFGGRTLTSWPVWVAFSVVFFLGLADLRRPLASRNLDLLALLSFGVSLASFNRGHIFASASLAVPPLVYLLLRTVWIGFWQRPVRPAVPVFGVAALVLATLLLSGFRIGLAFDRPGVIDVGYAGVIGADRILDGEAPYGNMPNEDGKKCGRPDGEGRVRDRIQTNGRCESANPFGDTYGPVAYLAYVPAVVTLGWSGKWDSLPAARATSILFDLAALGALALAGWRLGRARLAATLAFAWAAYPFTAYTLTSNTNDAIMPLFLVLGFCFAASAPARGALSSLACWTKFAALPTVPLWLTYPGPPRRRNVMLFTIGFLVAAVAAFWVLLLEPSLRDAVSTFFDRTLRIQFDRQSPFSLWDWGRYDAAGIPDLELVQKMVFVWVILLAGVAATVPRRKGPLELAALTAAVLLAFQLSLTHWFYLYLPWVFPFVLLALHLPRSQADQPECGSAAVTAAAADDP